MRRALLLLSALLPAVVVACVLTFASAALVTPPALAADGEPPPPAAEGTDVGKKVEAMAMALREAVNPGDTRVANVAAELAKLGAGADDALLDLLADPVAGVRLAAMQALATRHAKPHLAAFIELLKDEDENVAAAAVRVVALYDSDWATQSLVRWLGHESPLVRAAGIEVLKGRGASAAVTKIVREQYDDPPAAVGRGPFLAALGQFPDGKAESDLLAALEDDALAPYAVRGLEHMGPTVASKLAAFIVAKGEAKPELAAQLVTILGQMGKGGERAIAKVLTSGPLSARRGALRTAVATDEDGGAKRLTKLAKHSNADVRRVALEMMPGVPDANPAPSLGKNLRDKNADIRLLAARAVVGPRRRSDLQKTVLARYRQLAAKRSADNADDRREALEALGRIGNDSVVSELVQALGQPDEAAAAVVGLGSLGDRSIGPLLFVIKTGDGRRTAMAVRALAQAGPAAIAPLMKLLSHKSREVRFVARKAIAEAQAMVAVPELIRLVQDPKTPARPQLVAVLGRLVSDETLEALESFALQGPDHNVRLAAIKALARWKHDRVVEIARKAALKDSNPDVRHAAVEVVIGRGDVSFVPELRKMLGGEKLQIQATASFGIGYLAKLDVIPTLSKKLAAARTEEERAARFALQRLSWRPDLKQIEAFEDWYDEWSDRKIKHPAFAAKTMTLTDGTELAYWVGGGQAKPLIVIPGGPDWSHDYLRPGVDTLYEDRTLVYVDLPGRGKSKLPAGRVGSTVDQDAAAVATMVARLNMKGADVYGHSFGALVAVRLARKYPKLVGKLVLDSPPHPTLEGWVAEIEVAVKRVPEPWASDIKRLQDNAAMYDPAVRDRLLSLALMTGAVKRVPAMVHVAPRLQTNEDFRNASLAQMGDWDLTKEFAKLQVPTVLLVGDGAALTDAGRKWREGLANENDDVAMRMIPGAGFLPSHEAGGPWKKAITDFLK